METGIITGIFSESFWYVAPIIINIVTFATGYFIKWFNINKKWVKQVISWILASGLSVAAWGIKVISFGNPIWLGIIALCAVTGIASNGYYEIGVIKTFIKKITGQETTIS